MVGMLYTNLTPIQHSQRPGKYSPASNHNTKQGNFKSRGSKTKRKADKEPIGMNLFTSDDCLV